MKKFLSICGILLIILVVGGVFLINGSVHSFHSPYSRFPTFEDIKSSIRYLNKTSLVASQLSLNPENATGSNNIGLSVGESLLYLNDSEMAEQLDEIKRLGVGWIRFDIDWSHVQTNNSYDYYWLNVDRLVVSAHSRGIKLLPIIDDAPPWARSSKCVESTHCDPANHAQFAKFSEAVVSRYKSAGINVWEVWNEPNLHSFWQPSADSSSYLDLLKQTYESIKSVQPDSTILLGGMGPGENNGKDIAPIDFLSQIYAGGGESYFDAVAFHPYSFPAVPDLIRDSSAWSQMASTNPSLRSVMTANGDSDKRIWMTEFGAPTGGPGGLESSDTDTFFAGNPDHVTEALQAEILSQAIKSDKESSWAGPLFIYSYKDLGTSNSTIENFFGLVRADGSNKPAYSTVQKWYTLNQ